MSAGYYSVIQYCPNRARAETANVGVILLVPDRGFVKAHTSSGNDRARRVFRVTGASLEHLNAAKRAIASRLETERARFRTMADLLKFAETRGNDLILTSPRSIRIEGDPEVELRALFKELVGGREAKDPKPRLSELEGVFRRLEGRADVSIHPSFLIAEYKRIKVDYAFRNGALNLVRVHPFRREADMKVAAQWAAEGQHISRHGAGDERNAKTIVVSSTDDDLERRAASLLSEFHVEFVRRSQVPRFAERVEQTAH